MGLRVDCNDAKTSEQCVEAAKTALISKDGKTSTKGGEAAKTA